MRFLTAAFFILLALPALGRIDNRRYVGADEWRDSPELSRIVRLESCLSQLCTSCTAQYVAPNLIATNAHCLEPNGHHRIVRADRQTGRLELIDRGRYDRARRNWGEDWAILRIIDEDSHAFSNNFFQITEGIQRGAAVRNAGFGWMRIVTDAEIRNYRERMQRTRRHSDVNEASRQFYIEVVSELTDRTNRLKVSDCTVIRVHDGVSTTDCVATQGNSGGPFFVGNRLFGLLAYTSGRFTRGIIGDYQDNETTGGPISSQFANTVRNIRPDATVEVTTVVESPETDIERELEEKKEDIINTINNVDQLTDREVFNVLIDIVDHSVLSEKMQRYREARARETSLANRLLTAASIYTIGTGMTDMMAGRAQQEVDERYARQVGVIEQSLNCGIDGHQRIRHEQSGNAPMMPRDMVEMAQEYASIAANVRFIREQLGIPVGIAGEIPVDMRTAYAATAAQEFVFTGGFRTAQERAESGDAASRAQRGRNMALFGTVGAVGGDLLINQIMPGIGAGNPDAVNDRTTRRGEETLRGLAERTQ
ncbi:MAG: trypsin-like serine protease [Alphaproteobacteria bacterium]|nr:trypsin-like serine protease [Alphaproteobacteria bacterium]